MVGHASVFLWPPLRTPLQPFQSLQLYDYRCKYVLNKKYISIGTLLTPTLHLSDDVDGSQNFSSVFVRAGTELALPNPLYASSRSMTGIFVLQLKSTYLLGRCSYQLIIYQRM
jgi:hypothetical protein